MTDEIGFGLENPAVDSSISDSTESAGSAAYRVLARKYRPANFETLIGQEAMVRTLRNAFESDRIAHAFILSGIRGIGKTTTARILAKGLNCLGRDGKGGATVEPCGVCDSCVAISESRHIDVIEIDAASHTGVANIRALIESSQLRPNWGRYKVYIIDEAHMLSTSAFNALLKTLEEPPPHVKFIFATTEIRKMPLTVLSRCQRFDLRRVDPTVLADHLAKVTASEGSQIDPEALVLIARASEGSVRDGISLLDQAIAHSGDSITAESVRDMLGWADRSRVLDLFRLVCEGKAGEALKEFGEQIEMGADPISVLEGLIDACHWIALLRVAPELAKDPSTTPAEAERGSALKDTMAPATLIRFYQILESALIEAQASSMPRMAADMAIIRLTHASTLPTPEQLVEKLQRGGPSSAPTAASSGAGPAAGHSSNAPTSAAASSAAIANVTCLENLALLAKQHKNSMLLYDLENNIRVVEFEEGRIVYVPDKSLRQSFQHDLHRVLQEWTQKTWSLREIPDGGGSTLREQREQKHKSLHEQVIHHPEVQQIFQVFPDARIETIEPIVTDPSMRVH